MPKVILNPEIYPTWPLDNGLLLFNDEIIIDKNDLTERSLLKNRSTLDYKVNNYYKILKEEIKIIREIDYSTLLSEDERRGIHQKASDFVNNPKNFDDVYLIAKQAWDNYSTYLLSKIRYYDDPSEPAISVIKGKLDDTLRWKNRLFKIKEDFNFNDEEITALKNAATRTLSKALAGVTIYQKIVTEDSSSNFVIHDSNEYQHAFSVATKMLIEGNTDPFMIQNKDDILLVDLVYECYKVYSLKFNHLLIEKPAFLYNMRRNFETYRAALNELQILLSKFSYDCNITRNYVLFQLERIIDHLKIELLRLSKKVGKEWETLASVSFFNIPIGQLIRLLLERKVSEKEIQKRINKFFILKQNKGWKNLFVMLKNFEEFGRLDLTKNLKTIDKQYFKVRPDWWIDYLPWYEGGSKFIKPRGD